MYERFTDRARKVMQLANQEAQRFNHEYIGTEHILLGLIRENSGVAASTFRALNVEVHKIREEIEKIVQSGPDMVTMGKLPQTPRAKKVIEYAMEESRHLNHNYVGTEHILLGIIREEEGVAAQILLNMGLTREKLYRVLAEQKILEASLKVEAPVKVKPTGGPENVDEVVAKMVDLMAMYTKGMITGYEYLRRSKEVLDPFWNGDLITAQIAAYNRK